MQYNQYTDKAEVTKSTWKSKKKDSYGSEISDSAKYAVSVETSSNTSSDNVIESTVSENQNRNNNKRNISSFSINASKSRRYRAMASNLSTLAAKKIEDAAKEDKGWAIGTGINSVLASIIGIATGGIPGLTIATGLASGVNALGNSLFNGADDKRVEAQRYSNMVGNIQNYLSNLTNRDTTIMNAMDQIYSSMDNMRSMYGQSFVDTMYNYYLAKSGMTSDAYSLLTGNFNTFEDIGYGKVSQEGEIFDTLTDGNQDLFNNVYARLQLDDITGNKELLDSMVQSLYGSKTEIALQLQGYENDLRTALISSSRQQSYALSSARSDLESGNINARAENVNYAENIGSAEADSASSGTRGGTTTGSASLARLSRDLGQIQRNASIAAMIGTLKYNIQNAQLNASSTAYAYRSAQRKVVTNALNSTVNAWNSIGRASAGNERTANYYRDEAVENKRQFENSFNEMNEKDKDAIFNVATP